MKSNADILHGLASLGGIAGSAVWKSLIILAVAWGVTLIWRRGNPAARHLVWTATFICLLILPFLGRFTPSWHSPAWADPTALNGRLPESLQFVLNGSTPHSSEPAAPVVEKQTATTPSQPVSPTLSPDRRRTVTWGEIATAIWLVGVTIGLLRILTAQLRLQRWARSMRASENSEQLRIMEELQADFQLHRPVQLLIGSEFAAPMTWGIWQPVVVLPASADAWPDERLRVVLRHELAHICRRDCLTQEIARVACALYWFNPLAWLAARQMRAEREKACDDLVLNAGARPSAYAGHLVEIARQFSAAHFGGAVAMARPSGLESRVVAILDGRRNRSAIGKITIVSIVSAVFGLGLLIGGCSDKNSPKMWSLEHSEVSAQLKSFVAEKKTQEDKLLVLDENDYFKQGDTSKLKIPDCRPFFAAAAKGDWLAVSNHFQELQKTSAEKKAVYFRGRWWGPVLETYGAIEAFAGGDEKYSKLFGDEIIRSIPAGSIYFGGTDPGRFVVTALQKSPADGTVLVGGTLTNFNGTTANHIARLNSDGTLDETFTSSFYTLTQNALADNSYLDYLRSMYDGEIYIPTTGDAQKAFQDYTQDAQLRAKERKLKPGEVVKVTEGRVQVTGYVAVMEINGLLAKKIFDENPNREFYIEESFPLDWMYPSLEPHGLIFKLNRQPLTELSDEIVQRDHDYWTKMVSPMIGGWLNEDTSIEEIAEFANKVFARHDFSGFTGDPEFVLNAYSHKMFSKERGSIGGLYDWRARHAASDVEKKRMQDAADFAFRQAWALCPYSPEIVTGYVALLMSENRRADAILVAETAATMPEMQGADGEQVRSLVKQLKQWNQQSKAK